MGDAPVDGEVKPADPEETIDGAEPRQDPVSSVPVEVLAVVRDYPELLEVERRHYVVVRELARGGMGRVLEARDLRLGRQVAIKELLPKNRDIARRFEREARITARLQHPSIIHVYEAGVWQGGEPFYAMPIVPGRSLDGLVAEKKTFAERLALLPRVIAVADALAYAHDKNVIHRDLKPANVLVGEFGETVVIDWGLAKDLGAHTDPKESMRLPLRASPEETSSGSIVGTPAYMPPEQARGDGGDQRADVYSLGALLYKVLAGVAPYQGATSAGVIEQVKAGPPVPLGEREPDAPPELITIVSKAMARDPDHRYVTASELARDLKLFETGQLVQSHRYTAGQLVRRWLRRYRVAVGISTAAVAALAVVGVVSVRNVVEARDRAEARRVALLEERGRSELELGHAGEALTYLVAAAHDGFDAARGFLIAKAKRPFEAERAVLTRGGGSVVVATSPDGKHIATVDGEHVELWTPAGKAERVLGDHRGSSVVAFDLASTRVAVGGDDGTVEVWKLDGTPVRRFQAHAHAVLDLTFSIDGRLATAGADGVARVWNLTSGASVAATCAPADPSAKPPAVLSVRFDELGVLAAYGADDGSACVWETFTGHEVTPLRGHQGPITVVRWSPDGSWLATASADGTARVWSPRYGKTILEPLEQGARIEAAEISPDGTLLATGDASGGLRVWQIPERLPTGDDANIPRARGLELAGNGGGVVAIAFAPDGELLATAGADQLAKLWHAHTGQGVATFEHTRALTSIAFADGGRALVTGSRDGTSRVWDVDRVTPHLYEIDSAVHAIAMSGKGVLAVGLQDSNVEVLPPTDDDTFKKGLGSIYAAAFTRDGATLVTAGEDAQPTAWDIAHRTARNEQRVEPQQLAPFRAIATAPDGEHFATAGRDVRIWTLVTMAHSEKPLDSGGEMIRALAYTPAGDLLLGVSGDGSLFVWDAQGRQVARAALHIAARALAFSPDGRRLAVGGVATARVFAFDAGDVTTTPVASLDSPKGEVRALVFACGGVCLVTGNDTGTADVWDAATGKRFDTRDLHAGPVSGIALGENGTKAWISTEGTATVKAMVTDWNVGVESEGVHELDCFMAKHVPWHLGSDDVPIRNEGGSDDQRGSDCE